MKKFVFVVALIASVPSFAQVQKLKCTIGSDQTLNVTVTKPSEQERPAKISVKDFMLEEDLKVMITASYNGVSNTLKPGSSGNYSVRVILEKKDSRNPRYTVETGSLNFSATFPYSTTIIYSSKDEAEDEVDMGMMLVKCVATK